jgi:5-(carboxyamino)imidazole ribonucleotide synthase
MMHQAAISLGIDLRFMGPDRDDPVAQVSPHFEVGSAMSDLDLARLASSCEVVTFEHEVVDLEGLEDLERSGAVFRPSPKTLRLVADKLGMRRGVEWAGLPVPPWRQAKTADQVGEMMLEWPEIVVKLSRGGYDGRGVFVLDDREAAVALADRLLARRIPLLVEPRLAFEMEAAVIVARGVSGSEVVYDPVVTTQVDGQCREVRVPSGLAGPVAEEAKMLARKAAAALDVVGLLAIELFVVDGRLLVNELAVRPHNTGHHSIDACVTSQFENHIRAVLDLPLGDTALTTPAAAMVNVVGNGVGDDPRHRLAEALEVDSGARIHLYGKEPRPDRKIGHVTVCDTDPGRAAARAWAVVKTLGGDVPEEMRA